MTMAAFLCYQQFALYHFHNHNYFTHCNHLHDRLLFSDIPITLSSYSGACLTEALLQLCV